MSSDRSELFGRTTKMGRTGRGLRPCHVGFLAASLGAILLVAGCSGGDGRVPVYPVMGQVTVGGEVPEAALVVLYPAQGGGENELRPSAKVNQDGSFTLTTYEADDGAPAGRLHRHHPVEQARPEGQGLRSRPEHDPPGLCESRDFTLEGQSGGHSEYARTPRDRQIVHHRPMVDSPPSFSRSL